MNKEVTKNLTHYEFRDIDLNIELIDNETKRSYNLGVHIKIDLAKDNCELYVSQ
ncbi:unnamed protein product [marine sediment metagenome]|uniref:Uncharacterized protein n=1 Tax=marine sediment metagenome TaxID=412755 RepID=X1ELC7_9ZZZZ